LKNQRRLAMADSARKMPSSVERGCSDPAKSRKVTTSAVVPPTLLLIG